MSGSDRIRALLVAGAAGLGLAAAGIGVSVLVAIALAIAVSVAVAVAAAVALASLSASAAETLAADQAAAAASAPVAVTVAAPDAAAPTSGPLAIANLPVDEAAYQQGRRQQCIPLRDIRGHRVLDDRNIVFELPRGRFVLSQMHQRCEFLSQRDVISLESRMGGSQICALDQVNVLEPNVGFGRGSGVDTLGQFRIMGRCFLGPFEEITKEQMAAMRDAMKARRNDDRGLWDWITGG